MRLVKALTPLLIAVVLIYFLNSGFASLPPLGKLMDPVHGYMANAESKNAFNSDNIHLKNSDVKGTVYMDDRLVPHIYAEKDYDLYFLQGYVTAQYRLWQMDIQTRAASGRLSEIFGEKFIPYDKEQRHKGMVYAAETAVEEIKKDPELLTCVQAYTDGINAFMGVDVNHENGNMSYCDYPIEFKLLNYKPEKWTLLKTGLLLKYMASTLSGFDDDIESTNLQKLLGEENFNLLYPNRPAGIDPIIPLEKKYDFIPVIADSTKPQIAELYYKKVLNEFTETHEKNQVGSNNWVVGPSKTKNGFPILCNDPHLQLNLPSLWYEIQLHSSTSNCYGASLPGAPGIVIGFNENIAWGVTNAQVDVRDWYTITFKDESKSEYQYGDTWRKTTTRIEPIIVKGQETIMEPVIYTHYGPIVYNAETETMDSKQHSEITERKNMAMRWSALQPSIEIKTFYLLNRAKNYDDYREALTYYDCPAQNFVFGAHDGDIAITQQGKFPVKYTGEGRFILNGSNPADDYQTYIPDEQNPFIKNPERAFCSSANQHPTDSTYPYYYTSYDFEFYRNRVINNTLTNLSNIQVEDMQHLQQNNFNMMASEVLPFLLTHLNNNENAKTNLSDNIKHSLTKWNYYNHADSLSPTYFQIWWDTLYATLWDEMDNTEIAFVKPNMYNTVNAIKNFSENYVYFDITKTTDKKESLSDVIQMSFNAMCNMVNNIQSKNPAEILWYQHKSTDIMHISQIPAFSKTTIHNGGYRNIVNASSETHGPSWRMVVELSNPINAYGVYPGGQSGNPGSKYFDNFVDTWAKGEYYHLQFFTTETEAKKQAQFTLTFN